MICRCRDCANYVRRHDCCLRGHTIGAYKVKENGCVHYNKIAYREIRKYDYDYCCHKCEHSVMMDMEIQGIPFCNTPECDYQPKVRI